MCSVPDGWVVKTLGEVYDVRDGTHDSPKYQDTGYPLITSKNLKNNTITLDKIKFILKNDYININKRSKVNIGDILFAMIGTIGNPVVIREQSNFAIKNVALFKISEEQSNDFLKYYLEYSTKQMQKESKGSTQKFVSLGYLRNFNISLPTLAEQKRIVSILDKAFTEIAKAKTNAEQNLKNTKELFKNYLQDVFDNKGDDWEDKTLLKITTLLGDGLHGTPKYTVDGEYYFVNGNNLNDGKILFKENTKRVNIEEYKKYKKNLNERTVLVSINGTLGNVAFYNNEKIILGKSACYFNLIREVKKEYIKYVIQSPYFITYAHTEATGATIKNVSLKTMRNFIVPLPPIQTQKHIVKKLDALQNQTKKLETIYQQKIAILDELKKSVLEKAFSGEL